MQISYKLHKIKLLFTKRISMHFFFSREPFKVEKNVFKKKLFNFFFFYKNTFLFMLNMVLGILTFSTGKNICFQTCS